jgi:hypothetical protein
VTNSFRKENLTMNDLRTYIANGNSDPFRGALDPPMSRADAELYIPSRVKELLRSGGIVPRDFYPEDQDLRKSFYWGFDLSSDSPSTGDKATTLSKRNENAELKKLEREMAAHDGPPTAAETEKYLRLKYGPDDRFPNSYAASGDNSAIIAASTLGGLSKTTRVACVDDEPTSDSVGF